MEKNIFLEGLEQLEDGRYRLIEKVIIPNDAIETKKIEDNTITEAIKEEYGVSPDVFYTLPIWEQKAKNKNGRSYDQVMENVVGSQEATINLADHPKGNEDGNPKETWSVAKNPRISEGWMVADFYPVGNIGKLAVEIVEKGGPITISSSCLGTVDNYGNVLREGFALERYGDWVTNPSNGYKFYKNESVKENSNDISEKNLTIINIEDLEDSSNLKDKEKKQMDEKLQEKILTSNILSMIKEAEREENIPSRIKSLETILPFFDDGVSSDLKESVISKITECKSQLVEKAGKVDGLNESVREKDDAIKTLSEEKVRLEESLDTAKEIIERLKADWVKANAVMEALEAKYTEEKSKVVIQEAEIAELTEGIVLSEAKKKEADDEEEKDDEPMEDEEEKDAGEDSKKKTDDEEKDSDKKPKEEACKTKKKESEIPEDDKLKIFEYYKTKRKNHPSLIEIRQDVYKVNSFEEAKELIDNKIEESTKVAPITIQLREKITNPGKSDGNISAIDAFSKFRDR